MKKISSLQTLFVIFMLLQDLKITYFQSGVIYSKAFPQLVLAVTPRKVTCNLKHPILGDTDIKVTGFQIGLTKRSNEHTWTFTGDGLLYNNVS